LRLKKQRLSEISRKLDVLKEHSAKNASSDIQLQLIKIILNQVPLSGIEIKNEEFFRSRWNNKKRLFSNLSELRYPCSKKVTKKGRFNDVGESILYMATSELGTILESRAILEGKINYELFTICKIERTATKLVYLPLGMPGYHIGDKEDVLKKKINQYLYDEVTKIVDDKNRENYNSTISLSKHFLRQKINKYSGNNTLGLIFPSVESKKKSDKTTYNIALLPETFDNCFKIVEASVYCLTNEHSHIQLNELNRTRKIDNDDSINWAHTFKEMKKRISKGIRFDETICNNMRGIEKDI